MHAGELYMAQVRTLLQTSADSAGTESPELPPDAVLPEQFYGPPRGGAQTQSQVALMRAVLDDALSCYHKQFGPHTSHERRLAQEAEAWFLDHDDRWPFSFVSICHALNLEPEYLRRGLKQWRQHPPGAPRRKRRRTIPRQWPLRVAA
jgi:hypothetical protein